MSVDYAQMAKESLAVASVVIEAENPGAHYDVRYRELHDKQQSIIDSTAKRIIVRAGRRGGKTVASAAKAVKAFQRGRRVLYLAPTADQCQRFWFEVKWALQDALDKKALSKNETEQWIEKPNTQNRIRAKTAWDADSARGDYADLLICDEFQLMDPAVWTQVGAPMLLDNDGDALFIYTPPTIKSQSKASDKRHASKLFKKAEADTTGRWAAFYFSSQDNPYISKDALGEIAGDMTRREYEQEILAIDRDDNPNALWATDNIERLRVQRHPELTRIVIAVDPSASRGGDACGIIAAGVGMCMCKGEAELHGFILEDASIQASPKVWAQKAVSVYEKYEADKLIAETNMGGEMVCVTIGTIEGAPPVTMIHASRGKQVRAEPCSSLYELSRVHHVGDFDALEDEMTGWQPGGPSPNRLDAAVYALTELMLSGSKFEFICI